MSYVFAGSDSNGLAKALIALGQSFGARTLLLEGGGIVNGSFLKASLIDEINLIIYPGIDGLARVPSIFEYLGEEGERPADGLALRHLATETEKIQSKFDIGKSGEGCPVPGRKCLASTTHSRPIGGQFASVLSASTG